MVNIIWDLDGTLIDSSKEIMQSLELAINNSGLDLSKQIKPFIIGPTIDVIVKEAFPPETVTEDTLKMVIKSFREIYDYSDFRHTKSYSGLDSIISDVKNFIHHIVTNKPDMPAKRIIEKLKWTDYITSIQTPYSKLHNMNNEKQSKSDIMAEIIKKSDTNRSSFIGIGDMKADCIAAKSNNIKAIGVLWGTGTREELIDCCDYVSENAKQLSDYLYASIN